MTITATISLILSIIGAFLGTLSFYLTQVRKPKISIIAEKRIRIGYTGEGGGFQFYIPVTFINKTHQTGIISKIQLNIFATTNIKLIYKIDLARFSKVDEQSNRFLDSELPHAIAVNGKSSVSKLLRFSWWNTSQPKLVIDQPDYVLTFDFWSPHKSKPVARIKHHLIFNSDMLTQLEDFRSKNSPRTIEIPLDGASPNNEIISRLKM